MGVMYPTGLYPGCPCYACDSPTWATPFSARMSLCPTCGYKRCPGAMDHTKHPQPDDWADHVSGDLDPRQVSRVEGTQVWIMIGNTEVGPLPIENYSYTRVEVPDAVPE